MNYNYQQFYYIEWPEAQEVMELDPQHEHSTFSEDNGYFVECEWWDKIKGN